MSASNAFRSINRRPPEPMSVANESLPAADHDGMSPASEVLLRRDIVHVTSHPVRYPSIEISAGYRRRGSPARVGYRPPVNGSSLSLSARNRSADQVSSSATCPIGRIPYSLRIGQRLSRLMSTRFAFGYATQKVGDLGQFVVLDIEDGTQRAFAVREHERRRRFRRFIDNANAIRHPRDQVEMLGMRRPDSRVRLDQQFFGDGLRAHSDVLSVGDSPAPLDIGAGHSPCTILSNSRTGFRHPDNDQDGCSSVSRSAAPVVGYRPATLMLIGSDARPV